MELLILMCNMIEIDYFNYEFVEVLSVICVTERNGGNIGCVGVILLMCVSNMYITTSFLC